MDSIRGSRSEERAEAWELIERRLTNQLRQVDCRVSHSVPKQCEAAENAVAATLRARLRSNSLRPEGQQGRFKRRSME